MLRVLRRTSGFTLIELIVGMLIFSIGMTAILALLHATIDNSLYSRHEIIAANILREQVELVKNIRNSNVRNFIPYDSVKVDASTDMTFASGIYLIENTYTQTGMILDLNGKISDMPIRLKKINFSNNDSPTRFLATRLYLDPLGRYTHTISSSGTLYASYIMISPLTFRDALGSEIAVTDPSGNTQGHILDARVIIRAKNDYKEYDLKTVITDWKK